MKLSVIILALNERHNLPLAIESVRASGPVHEIIVCDGGSSDGMTEWAQGQQDVTLVSSVRGRGHQLRAGASAATGDVLWFVHADCRVHPNSVKAIRCAMRCPSCVAGAFPIRFTQQGRHNLELVASFHNLRSVTLQSFTGSQGIFMRRVTYEVIGGFPAWPLFEDVDIVRKLQRLGHIALMPVPISTSGRRYLACGTFKTAIKAASLTMLYNAGTPPARLKSSYPDIR